eukprot:4748468-Alexandrium_andersonii.AAC.1
MLADHGDVRAKEALRTVPGDVRELADLLDRHCAREAPQGGQLLAHGQPGQPARLAEGVEHEEERRARSTL